jgi:GAF domain-containing protein
MLNKIFELGIREDHHPLLRRKIKMSNQISFTFLVYMLLLDVVFIFLKQNNFLYLSLVVTVVYALPLLLSLIQFPLTSRFLMSILPSFGILSSHAAVLNNGEQPVPAIALFQFAVVILPWILFNAQEKFSLYVALALTTLSLFLFPAFNSLLDFNFDSNVLKTTFFDVFLRFSSVLVSFIILYVLQQDVLASEANSSRLIKEMQAQQAQLQANESKLSDYIREVEKAKEEDKIRQWRAEGIAKFNEIIRKDIQHIQGFYDEIIAEMVKQVEATQGGLFILNEEDEDEPFLTMEACYAYERSKYIDKKIYISEGLLGQSFQDKEPLLLTEVPENYVHITSGLGKSLPRCILIVPLKYNQQICGMIELASFKTFQPFHIEFVGRVGEIIASAILSAKINEKTQKLLRETQEQAEQMRAQEEEMRQNMEELHATQEEMQRKQKEIEIANQRMQANEEILRKNMLKLRDKENALNKLLEESEQRNKESQRTQEMLREQIMQLQEKEAQYLAKIKELESRQA